MKVIESDGFVSRARPKLQRRLRSPLDCRSTSVPGGGLPGWPFLSAAASICCSSLLRPPRLDADGMHEHCDIQARALRTSSRCALADASLPDRGSWSVPAHLPRRRWPASAVSHHLALLLQAHCRRWIVRIQRRFRPGVNRQDRRRTRCVAVSSGGGVCACAAAPIKAAAKASCFFIPGSPCRVAPRLLLSSPHPPWQN